jgi:hypothetical protein
LYDPPTDEVRIHPSPVRAASQRRMARWLRFGTVVALAVAIALGVVIYDARRSLDAALALARHDHALLIRASIREAAIAKQLRLVCIAEPRCHVPKHRR